jgi:cellobiose phosphorylase
MKMLLLTIAFLTGLSAVPAGAENKGFAFIFALSYTSKEAYHAPVFEHPVRGKKFNDKEYVADIKLIRKMEDDFEQHLKTKMQLRNMRFTITARTGFISEAVANGQLEAEKANLKIQGIEMKKVSDFHFKP